MWTYIHRCKVQKLIAVVEDERATHQWKSKLPYSSMKRCVLDGNTQAKLGIWGRLCPLPRHSFQLLQTMLEIMDDQTLATTYKEAVRELWNNQREGS
jgi:hypothetical protein